MMRSRRVVSPRLLAFTIVTASILLIISYILGGAALGAYGSWINYRNPYTEALRNIRSIEINLDPLADHVIFILLDGASSEVLLSLGDSIKDVSDLLSLGAFYPNGIANMPTYSVPSRASILSGAPPEISGVSSNDYKGALLIDNLVKIAWEKGYKVLCTGDESIKRLFRDYITECIDIPDGAGHGAASLKTGLDLFLKYAKEGHRVFLWIGVADIDMIAHKYGGWSQKYNNTIANMAPLVKAFLETLRSENLLEKTLIVVLSDHGMKKGGQHGGPEAEVRRVFIHIVSPYAKPGIYRGWYTQNDIAPTISMLMGWSIPSASIGVPLSEGLLLPGDRARIYIDASREQVNRVVATLAMSNGVNIDLSDPQKGYKNLVSALYSNGWEARLVVIAIIYVMIIVIIAAFYLAVRRSINILDLIVIVAAIASIETSYRVFYILIGGPTSLSDIYTFDEVIQKVRNSVIASSIIAGVFVGLTELTALQGGLLRALARLIIAMLASILLISMLSIAPTYIAYGPSIRFPFPDWGDALGYFLALIRSGLTGFYGLPSAVLAMLSIYLIKFVGDIIGMRYRLSRGVHTNSHKNP